jgi:hypothetical protein
LPEERDRLLPIDHAQGFVRRVEQKGHFHATTSFPTEAPCLRGPGCSIERVPSLCHKPRSKSSHCQSAECIRSVGRSAEKKDPRHV